MHHGLGRSFMPSSVRDPIPRASISPGVTYTKCAVTQTALSGGGRAVCMARGADASRARARARRRGSPGTRSSSLRSTYVAAPPGRTRAAPAVGTLVAAAGPARGVSFRFPFAFPCSSDIPTGLRGQERRRQETAKLRWVSGQGPEACGPTARGPGTAGRMCRRPLGLGGQGSERRSRPRSGVRMALRLGAVVSRKVTTTSEWSSRRRVDRA